MIKTTLIDAEDCVLKVLVSRDSKGALISVTMTVFDELGMRGVALDGAGADELRKAICPPEPLGNA